MSGEGRGQSPPFSSSPTMTTTEPATTQLHDAPNPKLAQGVELIGEYDGSGYKTPPQIAQRSDGQVAQLSTLLYRCAQRAEGNRMLQQIADEVGAEYGKDVSAD